MVGVNSRPASGLRVQDGRGGGASEAEDHGQEPNLNGTIKQQEADDAYEFKQQAGDDAPDQADSGQDELPHRDTPFSTPFLRSARYVDLVMPLARIIARCLLLSRPSYQRQGKGEPVAGASAERPIPVVYRWLIRVLEAGNRPFATNAGVVPAAEPAAEAGA